MSWFSKKDDDLGVWGWLGRMIVSVNFVPRVGPYVPTHIEVEHPKYPGIGAEVADLENVPWYGIHRAIIQDKDGEDWSVVELKYPFHSMRIMKSKLLVEVDPYAPEI